MVDKPILTNKQQKQTLSARKNRKKVSKVSLVSPHLTNYEPVADPIETDIIIKTLEALPRLIAEKKPIKWEVLKEIPKEKRKEYRKLQSEQHSDREIRDKLFFGINTITMNLEKDLLSCVLITKDVNPFIMVQHVIDMCSKRNVPVLILHTLRDTLKRVVGIKSTTMGIHKDTGGVEMLGEIVKSVKIVSERFVNANNGLKVSERECADGMHSIIDLSNDVSMRDDDVYLKRDRKIGRSFVPAVQKPPKNKAFDADFIGFVNDDDGKQKKEDDCRYVALQLKSLTGNAHRGKIKKPNFKPKKKSRNNNNKKKKLLPVASLL